MPSLKTISTVSMSEIPSDGSPRMTTRSACFPGTSVAIRSLSLAKMPSGANTFRISGYKLKPEDRMQQCYMPCGRRNNNSPASGWHSSTAAICSKSHRRCRTGWLKSLEKLAVGAFPGLLGGRNRKRQGWQRDLAN